MKQENEGFVYPTALVDWLQLQRHFRSFFVKPDWTASLSPPLAHVFLRDKSLQTSQSIMIAIYFHARIWWNYIYIFSTVALLFLRIKHAIFFRDKQQRQK